MKNTNNAMSKEPEKGRIFIVSAPSGAGKTTLCRRLRDRFPDLRYSVSHTTRPPRPGETDGVDYYFISKEEFLAGVDSGRWAEWAVVHGNYYGTSVNFLTRCIRNGLDVLMDIDVQGGKQIMDKFPEAVGVFIMPPSMEVLEQRLIKRGQDKAESIQTRIVNAEQEIAEKEIYRYIIVNDNLESAAGELISLVESYRSGSHEN